MRHWEATLWWVCFKGCYELGSCMSYFSPLVQQYQAYWAHIPHLLTTSPQLLAAPLPTKAACPTCTKSLTIFLFQASCNMWIYIPCHLKCRPPSTQSSRACYAAKWHDALAQVRVFDSLLMGPAVIDTAMANFGCISVVLSCLTDTRKFRGALCSYCALLAVCWHDLVRHSTCSTPAVPCRLCVRSTC